LQHPRYTFCVKRKHWYFRHKALGVIALPGEPGAPEFYRRYSELLALAKAAQPTSISDPDRSTLRWLALAYEKSPEFKQLKPLTQRDYAKRLGALVEKAGHVRYDSISKTGAIAVRNAYAEHPRQADYMVQVLSLLMTWAVDNDLLKTNAVLGVKKLNKKANVIGYKPWPEAAIERFLAEGKPSVRLGVLLGLYTGQRLGDVVKMTAGEYDGQEISVRQSKTTELLPIAVAKPLKDALDHRPFPDAAKLLVLDSGKPVASESSFSNALKREVRRLGLDDGLSFHGLRYAAAARLEEAGCTLGTITSIIGHRTYQMAMQYATKRRGSAEAARVFDERETAN
jgi:integrase